VKVFDDKGVAIHIDPKPCIDAREDIGEASAGARAGRSILRDRSVDPSTPSSQRYRHLYELTWMTHLHASAPLRTSAIFPHWVFSLPTCSSLREWEASSASIRRHSGHLSHRCTRRIRR